MLSLHVTLSYYKRPDIQEAMLRHVRGKEVAVRYGDGFGKRPDIIVYERDILGFAQKKATSFHISEETWTNPLQLKAGMQRQELDALRAGWDVVFDIDFPHWESTRIISAAIIGQLLDEGVPREAVSCKFSGNKGFHITIPFEAFKETLVDAEGNEVLVSDAFPEAARQLVEYTMFQLDNPDNGFALSERVLKICPDDLAEEQTLVVNAETARRVKEKMVGGTQFVCPSCQHASSSEESYVACEKCGSFMTRMDFDAEEDVETTTKLDLGVDSVLLSSRHTYRCPYSLHEKSGLASVPVPLDEVRYFERSSATPDKVRTDVPFLPRDVEPGCAHDLLAKAFLFVSPDHEPPRTFSEVKWVGDAAPEEVFPPAILKMLAGMADGRKRALFVLTNFLNSVGWSYEMIEARLNEWNEANPEPLRQNLLSQHVRYHKAKDQKVLPPNFDNNMYYKDLGVLVHDELSQRVKNPVQYVRLRMKQLGIGKDDKKPDEKSEDSAD